MFNLKLKNRKGDTLEFNNNSPFTVSEITGLSSSSAIINTSEIALVDGAKYNSSKVNMRTINLAFYIEREAAKNRVEVYKVLKSKQWVAIHYSGDYRNVYIEGYVESINIDHFAMKQIVSVSVLCPFPYFKDAQTIINELSNIISAFHFPFAIATERPIPFSYIEAIPSTTIINEGDATCGMVIKLYARGKVKKPKIFNYVTHDFIGLNVEMQMGDMIIINTQMGNKSIQLLRNGLYSNIFNSLMKDSKWLQLDAGENVFIYEVEEGVSFLDVRFIYTYLYEGV